VVVSKGFGRRAIDAFSTDKKENLDVLADPAQPTEAEIAKGAVLGAASSAAAKEAIGSLAGNGEPPVALVDAPTHGPKISWSKAAHDYSGFGLQGLLFFAIESAVALSRERRLGIWNRLRSAPVPTSIFVLSRGVSSTVLAFLIILGVFGFGAALFGIRILGSVLGFFGIALAAALMAGTFGLLMATLGRTETQSRGISILLILIMLATGGAWFPLHQMPLAVQKAAEFMPVRWAVEGFDAVTWRGMGLMDALHYIGPLTLFAACFGGLAIWRFRAMREAS
jgi:ABC-2 type transport system permease protein